MGDKPEKFANSRQWIGSVEVGYVMDSWVGSEHRIQFVSSGSFTLNKFQYVKFKLKPYSDSIVQTDPSEKNRSTETTSFLRNLTFLSPIGALYG